MGTVPVSRLGTADCLKHQPLNMLEGIKVIVIHFYPIRPFYYLLSIKSIHFND